MTDKIKYAFARSSFYHSIGGDCDEQDGMELRDYFAAHAPDVADSRVIEEVEGFPVFDNSGYFNGSPSTEIRESQRQQQLKWMRQARIKWRWQYADAMIAAR